MTKLIHGQREPEQRLAKKKFNFQLTANETSDKLSGFKHNAISPFGLNVIMPIVMCSRILDLKPAVIYLGGGKRDVKVSIPISNLLASVPVIVGEITDLR